MVSKGKTTKGMDAGREAHPSWLPGKSPQFVATIVVNLIAFSFGSAAGWPSVAQPQLKRLGASDEALSWAAAIVWPAGLVGAALFGPATERWGRRVAALLVAAPLAVGWALLALPALWIDIDGVADLGGHLAPRVLEDVIADVTGGEVLEAADESDVDLAVAIVLVARVLLGVGMGGVLIVCPMYVGEVVEDSLRGQLGSYMVLFVNAGILFVYAVGAQVGFATLAMCCALFPVAFLALFTWLLSRGDEAMLWLRDPRCGDVGGELSALRASLKLDDPAPQQAVGPRSLVATRAARRAMTIVMGLCALQQFSGITAIVNNASDIFAMAGSSLRPDIWRPWSWPPCSWRARWPLAGWRTARAGCRCCTPRTAAWRPRWACWGPASTGPACCPAGCPSPACRSSSSSTPWARAPDPSCSWLRSCRRRCAPSARRPRSASSSRSPSSSPSSTRRSLPRSARRAAFGCSPPAAPPASSSCTSPSPRPRAAPWTTSSPSCRPAPRPPRPPRPGRPPAWSERDMRLRAALSNVSSRTHVTHDT